MDALPESTLSGDETLARWVSLHADELGEIDVPDPADLVDRQEPLLYVAEAARFLGRSRAETYQLIESGALPAFRLTCREQHHVGHDAGCTRLLVARRDLVALTESG